MEVIFEALEVNNFRGFSGHLAFKFGPRVLITGDNGVGKSSIAEAIVYALYGVDIQGSNKHLESLVGKAGKDMQVTLTLRVDAARHVVSRGRKGSKGYLALNGVPATQDSVERLVGPQAYFLAAFLPGTVLRMPDKAARDFFMSLVAPVEPATVLNEIGPWAEYLLPSLLGNPDAYASQVRTENKQAEHDLAYLSGKRDTLSKMLSEPVPEAVPLEDLERAVEEATEALEARRRGDADPEAKDMARRMVDLQARLVFLQNRYQELQKQLTKVNIKEGDTCPITAQPFPASCIEAAVRIAESRNLSLQAEMDQVAGEGRKVRAELEAARTEQLFRQAASYPEEEKALAEAKKRLAEAVAQNAQRERILQQREQALAGIAECKEKEGRLRETIFRNNETLKGIARYQAKSAEIQAEQITRHFRRASLQLWEVTKTTGELRETFDLLYDGKPLRMLCYSDTIRLGLEVTQAIKNLLGVTWPTFLDNAESITSMDEPAGQVFIARVVEGEPLTVTVEGIRFSEAQVVAG